MPIAIEIVSATRRSKDDFWHASALGRSLKRLAHDQRLVARIAYDNTRALPDVYNARIAAADRQSILVFVHDDVWIDDFFLPERVTEGCTAYDVIGVAGNRRRAKAQPVWASPGIPLGWDDKSNLSGSMAHGMEPFGAVTSFGTVPAECELLDGVFLAAKSATLANHGVAFDPRFDFHFYDMDFCRSAREKGLRLGTWPICITHQSNGAVGSPAWVAKYELYLAKWGG